MLPLLNPLTTGAVYKPRTKWPEAGVAYVNNVLIFDNIEEWLYIYNEIKIKQIQ